MRRLTAALLIRSLSALILFPTLTLPAIFQTSKWCPTDYCCSACQMALGGGIPLFVAIDSGSATSKSVVTDYESNVISFSYDPPFLTYVSPNTPDANGDTISIYGKNFGSSHAAAGEQSFPSLEGSRNTRRSRLQRTHDNPLLPIQVTSP